MREIPVTDRPLDPSALLNGPDLRLTLHASLKPASGLDRFQPAGFPEIGHVIYDAPRRAVQAGLHETVAPDNRVQKVCIVDSAASMANHLESVCLASEHSLELASELAGMPYVECRTDDGWPNVPADGKGPKQLVVTTLSEAHRLASTYFLDGKVVEHGKPGERKFGDVLREEFKIERLLRGPFRYRTNCDLELHELRMRGGEDPVDPPAIDITSAIKRAGIDGPPVTQVYWPADELFRAGADEREADSDSDDEQDAED